MSASPNGVLEGQGPLGAGALEGQARHGVVRDDVHLARNTTQKAGQASRIHVAVIDTRKQDVFEGDATMVGQGKAACAASSAAMFQCRLIGMIWSRTSSVVALSEMARFGAGRSLASSSIPDTTRRWKRSGVGATGRHPKDAGRF